MANSTRSEQIALAIGNAIDQAGASKNSIAQKTGIPYSTLNSKLKGRTDFSIVEVLDIAEAIGTDPSRLIPSEISLALAGTPAGE